MNDHLQATATVFSLINPAVCAMIFSGLIKGRSRSDSIADATKAIAVIAVVLTIAAFVGGPILILFGISLDVFSVAGGIVLAFIGFSMMTGSNSSSTPKELEEAPEASPELDKLILFAASPGTITGVITIVAAHSNESVPTTALFAITVTLVVTWGFLVAVSFRSGTTGKQSLASVMVSRYMGLIVIAMGIQFALSGYKAFLAS